MTGEDVASLVDCLRHRPVATTAAQMRDALPATTVASMKLRGIAPDLATRMDMAGYNGRERYAEHLESKP